MVGRLVNGVVGGLAGGLLFGVLMQTIGMIPMVAMLVGSKSVVVGWRIDSYHASTADNAIIVTMNSPARAARTPPQRNRGQRVGEVVDRVGQQRHRPAVPGSRASSIESTASSPSHHRSWDRGDRPGRADPRS